MVSILTHLPRLAESVPHDYKQYVGVERHADGQYAIRIQNIRYMDDDFEYHSHFIVGMGSCSPCILAR